MKCFESFHWLGNFFHKPMVLLDNIIEVFNLSHINLGEQSAHHEAQCHKWYQDAPTVEEISLIGQTEKAIASLQKVNQQILAK